MRQSRERRLLQSADEGHVTLSDWLEACLAICTDPGAPYRKAGGRSKVRDDPASLVVRRFQRRARPLIRFA